MLHSVHFFLSAEVEERVSKHGHHTITVQAFARSKHKSKIDSVRKKQENRRFAVTEAFADSSTSFVWKF